MFYNDQVAELLESHTKLKLDSARRDIILLIGITGVGKSTLAEIMFGDLPYLHSTPNLTFMCYEIRNIKDSPAVTHSMFDSDTICPQLYTDPTYPTIAIYDCPGFEDTRGTSNEIATGLYLSNIVQHADRVKLVVTVGYDAVQPNVDRKKFTENVLPEVLDFVQNNNVFKTGVFLLVNKYANQAGDFSDDAIVTSIAKFLEKAQHYAVEKWPQRKEAIEALFNGSWLLKDDNGKYTNIGFARMITGEGPLEKMDSVIHNRDRLRSQLLDNPNFNFISCDASDFGCPISQGAKLEIRKVQRNLVSQAKQLLDSVASKIELRFIRSKPHKLTLSRNLRYFVDALDDLEDLKEGLCSESLMIIRKLLEDIAVNGDIELHDLGDIIRKLTFTSGVDPRETAEAWHSVNDYMTTALQRLEKDVGLHSGVWLMFPDGFVCA